MNNKGRLLSDQENADRGRVSEVVSYSQFHLKEVLDEVFVPLIPLAQERNAGLHLQYGANIPDILVSDKQKICWILEWIIAHALKRVRGGEVNVLLHIDRSNYDHPELAFTVKYEHGKTAGKKQDKSEYGAPAELDRPEHGDKGSTADIDRFRWVVGLMGGKCMVNKDSGESDYAFFTVPLMPEHHNDLSDHDDSDYVIDDKGLKVLIVEDDFTNKFYLAGFLKSKGWLVDTADNGLHAVEQFEPGKYDLVIMDGHMPVMDGFAAARKIREAEDRQTYTPILAISGYAVPEDRGRFIEAGMDDFLAKPIDETKLLRLIRKLTDKPPID